MFAEDVPTKQGVGTISHEQPCIDTEWKLFYMSVGETSTREQVDVGKDIIDDPNAQVFTGGVTGDATQGEPFLGVPFLI